MNRHEQDYQKKLDNYTERHKDWRDISLNQLSNVNNVFTGIAIGFLGFVFKPELISEFTFSICNLQSKPTLICFSFILLTLSICLGLLVLLTRLYDFRISRNLALTRKRTLEYYSGLDKGLLPNNKHEEIKRGEKLLALFQLIFCKINLINWSDVKGSKEALKIKFVALQNLSNRLGEATWKWLKMQILFFLLSVVFYTLFII